jgi:tyrosyl-tRNA synthetase
MRARQEFAARFSKRSFSDVSDLPVVADLEFPIIEAVKNPGFAESNGDVRRVAERTVCGSSSRPMAGRSRRR